MRLGRRVCALVAALALGAAGPVSLPRSCPSCPRDCPMHAQGRGEPGDAGKRLGCHRAAAPVAADTVCLRATCGAGVALEALSLVGAVARGERDLGPTLTAARLPLRSTAGPTAPALEPPIEPPRVPV